MRILQGFLLLILFLTQMVFAATPVILPVPTFTETVSKVLTLHDAIMLLIRNDPDLQSAYLQRIVDKYQLEIAYNTFAPQYILGGIASYETGMNPKYTSNPKISLKSPFGSEFSVDTANTWNEDGYSAVGTVQVSQPLLRGFGRSVVQNQLIRAKWGEITNQLTLKSEVMKHIVSLVSSYYQLVQDYNDLKITKLSLQMSQENLQDTNAKIQVGKTPRTDRVQYEQQVAQDQFTITQDENIIQKDYQALLTLLGLDPNSKLSVIRTIDVKFSPLPSQQRAIALVLANNIPYQKALIQYQLDKQAIIVAADKRKWKLDLTAKATRSLTGEGSGMPPVNGADLDRTDRSLLVELDIPIDDVSSKVDYETTKIALQQERINVLKEKRQTKTDVIDALRDLKSQKTQIKLAENTVTWSQQSLAIEQKKAKYGRSTPLDVTTVQNTLTSNRLQLITAKIRYINLLQQFYETLGITLKKWGIKINY